MHKVVAQKEKTLCKMFYQTGKKLSKKCLKSNMKAI